MAVLVLRFVCRIKLEEICAIYVCLTIKSLQPKNLPIVQQKEQELTISQFCLRSLGKFKRTVYDYESCTFVGP